MKQITMAEARAAKDKLALVVNDLPELSGIGVAVLETGGYGIKVILSLWPAAHAIPSDLDGVPVIIEVVGEIDSE